MQEDHLFEQLHQIDYFESINDIRVLTFLISQPRAVTAKKITNALDIPNSKIYPALNRLMELELITSPTSSRPHKYLFSNPSQLEQFLDEQFQQEYQKKQDMIGQIMDKVYLHWDPNEQKLGKVARIFHNDEIESELVRMLKQCKKEILILLNEEIDRSVYFDTIFEMLGELLDKEVKVRLSIPSNNEFIDKLDHLQSDPNLYIRESIWDGNSYIIRDQNIMLNITHRPTGDVAILTNDQLLVGNIHDCWNDTNCCTIDGFVELEVNI